MTPNEKGTQTEQPPDDFPTARKRWLIAGVIVPLVTSLRGYTALAAYGVRKTGFAPMLTLRYAGQLVFSAVMGRADTGSWAFLRPKRPKILIQQSLALLFATGFLFTAAAGLPIATVSSVNFLWPAMVVMYESAKKGAAPSANQIRSILICFFGVFLTTGVDINHLGETMNAYLLAAFAGALSNTTAILLAKKSSNAKEEVPTQLFWTGLVGTLPSALLWGFVVFAPHSWVPHGLQIAPLTLPKPGHAAIAAALIFVLGYVQQRLLAVAIRLVRDQTVLMPFTYLQGVWALMWDYFLFDTAPTVGRFFGVLLIFVGAWIGRGNGNGSSKPPEAAAPEPVKPKEE